MTTQSKAQDLLRRTFGHTTPMQSDERMMQEPQGRSSADAAQPWTKDEMLAAGIPEPLHPLVGYYDSLEEAKAELAASGAKLNP